MEKHTNKHNKILRKLSKYMYFQLRYTISTHKVSIQIIIILLVLA